MTRARRGRRQRGASLYYVLMLFAALGVLAATWTSSFQALHAHSGPSLERARARAVATAAWERALRALERGDGPDFTGPVLCGQARVRARRHAEATWRIEVLGEVPSALHGGRVQSKLVAWVRISGGRVQVLRRLEVGA